MVLVTVSTKEWLLHVAINFKIYFKLFKSDNNYFGFLSNYLETLLKSKFDRLIFKFLS